MDRDKAFAQGASITEARKNKVMAAEKLLPAKPASSQSGTNLTHQVAVLVNDFENSHKLPFLAKLTLAAPKGCWGEPLR